MILYDQQRIYYKPAAFHLVLPWLLLFTLTIGIAHYWETILETVTAAAMEKKRHGQRQITNILYGGVALP